MLLMRCPYPLYAIPHQKLVSAAATFAAKTEPRLGYLSLANRVSQGKDGQPLLLKCSKTGLRCMGMIYHAHDVIP